MNTPQHWLIELYQHFAPKRRVIKISGDHLPGLRAPKPMPWAPPLPDVTPGAMSDIDVLYRRFRASESPARLAAKLHQRGVDF